VAPSQRRSEPPKFESTIPRSSRRFPLPRSRVVVQPPVSGVVCLEPYRGDDRAVDGRSLLDDAVSFDGDEDLRAVGGGTRPVEVRTPDAIFAPLRMIRPVHRSADPRTHDVTLPGPEAGGLVLAVRGQPRPSPYSIRNVQSSSSRIDLPQGHRGMLFGRCGIETTSGPSPNRPGTVLARRRSERVASSSSRHQRAA